ncbi:hypothetical protein KR100_10245 [Synechococcus sp. KORDI-100]|nr:hypothetical protein KR100_10245 [Synechococcus sp. KORDI-100]
MGRRVESKQLLARRQTEAAVFSRLVQLIYFRQSIAAEYLTTIGLGISDVQAFCLSFDESEAKSLRCQQAMTNQKLIH